MFVEPGRNKPFCRVVAITQLPTIAHLLHAGYVVPLLLATVLGSALGWMLRPKLREPRAAAFLVLLITALWMAEIFYPHTTGGPLLDQLMSAVVIVGLWPDDPQDRLRKRLDALKTALRRWSTGMPLPI